MPPMAITERQARLLHPRSVAQGRLRVRGDGDRWPPLVRTACIVSICLAFWVWVAYLLLR